MTSGELPWQEKVAEVDRAVAATRQYWAGVGAGPAASLDFYTRDYPLLLNKHAIEGDLRQRLMQAALEEGTPPAFYTLPPSALQRVSGALLQWILGQLRPEAGGPWRSQLPEVLAHYPQLTAEQAEAFAWGWFCWPQTPALQLESTQQGVVSWLHAWPQASGWLASALVKIGNEELAHTVIQSWNLSTFYAQGSHRWLQPVLMSPNPALREAGLNALGVSLVVNHQPQPVEQLCRLCFNLAQAYEYQHHDLETAERLYAHALQATEILLNQRSEQRAIVSIRIAALAHLGQGVLDKPDPHHRTAVYQAAAVRTYGEQWRPTHQTYPFPHKLLPALQETRGPMRNSLSEKDNLWQHLLQDLLPPDNMPEWVHNWLRAEQADQKGNWNEAMRLWHHLFKTTLEGTMQWLYFLERLTEVYPQAMKNHPERRELEEAWRGIQNHPQMPLELIDRATAGIMVLQPKRSPQLIAEYQRRPFHSRYDAHPLIALAARRYMRDILHHGRLGDLRVLLDPNKDPRGRQLQSLRTICLSEEYYLFQKLAQMESWLEQPPRQYEVLHCRLLWESLLGLEVIQKEPDYVSVLLNQFFRVRDKFEQRHKDRHWHDRGWIDLELQLERRLKAIAEYWLRQRFEQSNQTHMRHLTSQLRTVALGRSLEAVLNEIL